MNRRQLGRRLLLGIGLLAVAAAGAWLYRAYFTATTHALERAEGLAFRRMEVAQLEEPGNYRFYFATNRTDQNGATQVEERFGTARSPDLSFGSFDVTIESTLGLGMLINPTDWLQTREIQLKATRLVEPDAFAAQLREIVERSPRRTLLVVVHGFRDSFLSALRKTAFLGHVLDLNTPILVFDWPGNQGSSPQGYLRARRAAKASAGELARLLDLVAREVAPERMSLIANSMGGQVVVDALRILHQGREAATAHPLMDNVLLSAPDVEYQEFNQEFRQVLEALARHTTIYVSSNDRALLASRLLNRARRLGESRFRPGQAQGRVQVVDQDPNLDPITVVDVTSVNRTRNFHNFSLETPEFYDDVYLRLANTQVPRYRLLYPVEGSSGAVYWVLTSGR